MVAALYGIAGFRYRPVAATFRMLAYTESSTGLLLEWFFSSQRENFNYWKSLNTATANYLCTSFNFSLASTSSESVERSLQSADRKITVTILKFCLGLIGVV